MSENSILKILTKSKECVGRGLEARKLTNHIPASDETFDHFITLAREQHSPHFSPLPSQLKNLISGLYQKGNLLIAVVDIEPGIFPYKAFHALDIHQRSDYVKELYGKYISVLTRAADGIHFEPKAFSYLIREEFFNNGGERLIFPCLILPITIPDQLETLWPYLAMREFNFDIASEIPYKYLAIEQQEVELLKRWNLYD